MGLKKNLIQELIMLILFFVFVFVPKIYSQGVIQTYEEVTVESIILDINEGNAINYQNSIIKGIFDIKDVKNKNKDIITLKDRKYIVYVDNSIIFVNCIFEDDILFYSEFDGSNVVTNFGRNVRFIDCSFKGNLYFNNSYFNNEVSFSECNFHNSIYFDNSEINGEILFYANIFDKEFSFYNVKSNDNIIFYANDTNRVIFEDNLIKGNIIIQSNKIGDFFSFYNTKILGSFEISNTNFYGNTDFSKVLFNQNLEISSSKFEKLCQFIECIFNEFSIKDSEFIEKIDFYNSTFKMDTYLQGLFNSGAIFELTSHYANFSIVNSTFMDELLLKNIYVLNSFYFYNTFFDYSLIIADSRFIGNFYLLMSEIGENFIINNSYFIQPHIKTDNSNIKGYIRLLNNYRFVGEAIETIELLDEVVTD